MAWKLLSTASFVLFVTLTLSGCGDKKGGENESGIEKDGSCSSQLVNDARDLDSAKTRDEAKSNCTKFLKKWPAPMQCTRLDGDKGVRVDTSGLKAKCDAL